MPFGLNPQHAHFSQRLRKRYQIFLVKNSLDRIKQNKILIHNDWTPWRCDYLSYLEGLMGGWVNIIQLFLCKQFNEAPMDFRWSSKRRLVRFSFFLCYPFSVFLWSVFRIPMLSIFRSTTLWLKARTCLYDRDLKHYFLKFLNMRILKQGIGELECRKHYPLLVISKTSMVHTGHWGMLRSM